MDFFDSKNRWKQILIRVPHEWHYEVTMLADKYEVPTGDLISFVLLYGQLIHGKLNPEVLDAIANYRWHRLVRQCYARSVGVRKRENNRAEQRREETRRFEKALSKCHLANRRHKRPRKSAAGDEGSGSSLPCSSSEAGTELRESPDGSGKNKRRRYRNVIKGGRRGRRPTFRHLID